MYYIYTLSCPKTNEIRYVGKSNNPHKRYNAHYSDKTKSYKTSWIRTLKNEGLKPILNIIDSFDDEDKCFEAEIKYIELYQGNLTNLSKGGKSDRFKTSEGVNTKYTVNTEIALLIKEDLINTDIPIRDIVNKFNVTKNIVENIKRGITWSNVTGFTGKEKWNRRDVGNISDLLRNSGVFETRKVKVIQYDLNNNLIEEFESITEASLKTNTNRVGISDCLSGKIKTANKFIWKRK